MIVMTCCDRRYATVAESLGHKCMPLTKAIELVVADTRENTNPNLTILEVMGMVRVYDGAEFDSWLDEGIVDKTLYSAYVTVADATDAEIMRAAEECLARALVMVAARNTQPMRFKRMMSFLGAINTGFAPISTTFRNQAGYHWLGKGPTDRQYIESIELGVRVTQSFDQR